jgi:hypothetical protein
MAVLWTDAALADLEARDIEPALVQRALLEPDEVEPGPPLIHALRYWDLAANREMWLRVRIDAHGTGLTVAGAEKRPVYPE